MYIDNKDKYNHHIDLSTNMLLQLISILICNLHMRVYTFIENGGLVDKNKM